MQKEFTILNENRVQENFARDVLSGLSRYPRHIPSKYFYDSQGSLLFEEIMKLPEYYPTGCEKEIFETHKAKFLPGPEWNNFQLIDLGAGDGEKTRVLLEHFSSQKISFSYTPVDIDANIMEVLINSVERDFPMLETEPVVGEYVEALHWLKENSRRQKLVLFMGGNIGNFEKHAAIHFLTSLRKALNPGDALLIGFDLKKNPYTILRAYDDSKGVTAEFNYNLLSRMNRELGADFIIANWQHYATYDPISGATQSFLISQKKQQVYFKNLDATFSFDIYEPIHMEYSMKYSADEVNSIAEKAGFSLSKNFFCHRNWFMDALWVVK